MNCQSCSNRAVFHLTFARQRKCFEEKHLCEEHARQTLTQFGDEKLPPIGKPARLGDATEFDVDAVVISEINETQVIYLREVGGLRRFPILIGIFEASSIDRRLKGLLSPRPLTHDAMAATIEALGGTLRSANINDLREHTYFSTLRIDQAGQVREVDVRPSDALMLALTCGAPIFVREHVLQDVFGTSSQDSP